MIIELAFMLLVLPQMIYPAARAQGRDPLGWTIFAAGICLSTGLAVYFGYFVTYELSATWLNFNNDPQRFWLTGYIRLIARICGILGAYLVYRYLAPQPQVAPATPPPPPKFD